MRALPGAHGSLRPHRRSSPGAPAAPSESRAAAGERSPCPPPEVSRAGGDRWGRRSVGAAIPGPPRVTGILPGTLAGPRAAGGARAACASPCGARRRFLCLPALPGRRKCTESIVAETFKEARWEPRFHGKIWGVFHRGKYCKFSRAWSEI